MRQIKGISEAFNHAKEWEGNWNGYSMVKPISPALRATDYKCPKYVWYIYETD